MPLGLKHIVFTGAGLLACFAAIYAVQSQSAEAEVTVEELSKLYGIDISKSLCSVQTQTAQKTALYSQATTNGQLSTAMSMTPEQGVSTSLPSPMDHSHIPIAIPDGTAAPRLSVIALTPDIMSGYNLTLKSENYEFMVPPQGLTMEEMMVPFVNPQTGFAQGHAHLYINGEKIRRVYGERLHLPAALFKPGMNQLNITLNNHAHMYWTYDDKEIITSLFINPSMPKLIMYQFDSYPLSE